ncbi:hypothetical protein CEUSTIGMA_g8827.t1 [Chlamydomonas eustigma]|uniref:Protein kinase domain-containing protein n=1 Tax=Chlamydomonas eustigma TaxID=1157962 RepID=A0A250XEA7_9CHLO|nr:hypothetical protein CEUSTIGMA_g8827.t1 [Chlamydomonas eustigma]|eukprot:GAX81396.1 hypothetical protein CEUSTIGMA_g8827.t1 [Chlamydomonas eustigma]
MQLSGDTQLDATKPARAMPRHKSGPQQDEQVLSFVRKLRENKHLKVLKVNHNNAPNQVPRTGLPIRVLADVVGPHENLILPAQKIVKKSNNVKQLSNGSNNKQMTPPATTHNNDDDTTSAGANKQKGAGHHDPCSVLHIPSTPSSHSSSSPSSDDDEGMMSSSRTSSERSVHSVGHSNNCSGMKQALLTIPACCPCIAPAAPPPPALNKHTALSPAASKPAWRLPSKCISNQQMNRMSPSCQHLPSGSRASMLKKAGGGHKKPAAAISNHPQQQPVAANKPVLQVPSTITSVVSVGVQVSLEDTEAVHDNLAADIITTRVQELETRMAECATLVTRLICEKEAALLTTEHQGQALRAEQELRKCLEEECERLRVQVDQCDAHHEASCIITLQLVLNKADADYESISSNKDIGLVCVAEAVQQVAVAEKETMMRPAALSVDEMMRPLEVHEELVRLQEQYKSLEAEVQEYKDQEVRYEEMLDMCRSEIAALTQSSDSARQEAEDELRLRKHQEDRIAQLKKWMVLHGKPLERINREDLECSHIMEQIGQGGWGEVFRIKYGPHRGSIYKHALPGLETEMDSEVVTMYWAMIAKASPNIMCLVVEDVSPGGSRWTNLSEQTVVGYLMQDMEEGDMNCVLNKTRCPHRKMDLIYAASKSLQTLHKAGIVHNDLKASNFLVNEHRGVKVSDFGTSLFMDATGHVEGPTLGTSGYAAPETLTTGQVSAAADVYSLGCMLYAMISGQQAHQGLYSNDQEYSELMLSGNVPQLTLRPEDVAMYGKIAAPLLQDLVTRTTHMEPQQRPSMKEVLDLLLNIKMNIMS